MSKVITLTTEQVDVVNGLIRWASNINSPIDAALIGSAGTGKTTVLKEFLSKIRTSVAISAPTHKAKKQLMKVTGLEGETIQALLGLKPNVDALEFDIDNPMFSMTGTRRIGAYKLAIIDESSMLNHDLFTAIIKLAKENHTKVLFVGDALQLPPVKEDVSIALIAPSIKFELTKIIRQKDSNPCNILLGLLRDDILNNTDMVKTYLATNPEAVNDEGEGYKVYHFANKNEQREFAQKLIDETIKCNTLGDPDYCKFTTWTNENVLATNKFLRKRCYEVPFYLRVGDMLMSYRGVKKEIRVVNNSSKARVGSPRFSGWKTQMIDITNNSEDYIVRSMRDANIQEMDVYVCNISTSDNTYNVDVNIVKPDSFELFKYKHDFLRDLAINANYGKPTRDAWSRFYAFRNDFLLLEDIDNIGTKGADKDFDFAHCITVHKSQGSTYENVFLNLNDISRNRNATHRRKLTYVGASRTSKFIHILV